jgi:hypothetical protein
MSKAGKLTKVAATPKTGAAPKTPTSMDMEGLNSLSEKQKRKRALKIQKEEDEGDEIIANIFGTESYTSCIVICQ